MLVHMYMRSGVLRSFKDNAGAYICLFEVAINNGSDGTLTLGFHMKVIFYLLD